MSRSRPAARPDSWQTKPMTEPVVRFAVNRSFSAVEMERVRDGFVPDAMEDKWFVVFTDDELVFHRSWTGQCVYRMHFEHAADSGGRAVAITAARDPQRHTAEDERYDVDLVMRLVDGLLLGRR